MIEVPRRAFDAKVMLHSIRLLRAMGRFLGRRNVLVDFEVELTRTMGLFDRDHYLAQIDPTELGGQSALRHYVCVGDARGLSPSPLFDVRHFDAHAGRRMGINRLLHYGLLSCFEGLSTTPWFDIEHYLRNNPDVGQTPVQALAHFQRWGWREGRSPLPGLDMRRLLMSRPELSVVRGGALSWLGREWSQGRGNPVDGSGSIFGAEVAADTTDMLDPAIWARVAPRRWDVPPRVDVLVPVYGGLQETLQCLHSVLTAPVRTPHRVIVINDAGPVPELNAMLRSLAARDLFVLEQHRSNQGFVRTVNHGLRISRDLDVVLLNSDTVVYGDWLDRLMAHVDDHPRLATLTPLSNNATICSYPETLANNSLPLEIGDAEIDRLAARVNARQHVRVPTGVGFCMYVRRETLREIGPLDERHFGRGYGEENDLCQRAQRRGWVNAIACDVYVRHVGSVSFKAEAVERSRAAQKVLHKLHPDYAASVARHIEADPVWIHRARIDLARLARLRSPRNVLQVCHNRGGGTERHVLEQSRQLQNEGIGVFELRPSHASGAVALLHPGLFGLQNLAALPLHQEGLFDEALDQLAIEAIHVHHLIDFPAQVGSWLVAAAGRRGIDLKLAVHDYYTVCPRVNLVHAEGHYCGEPAEAECNHCLAADGTLGRTGTIESWREASRGLLRAAAQVIVPSADVARRLAALAPGVEVQIEPHEPDPPSMLHRHWSPPATRPLKVLVVGAINRIKGYDVLLGLARQVREASLPIEVALLGYSSDDGALAMAGVRLLGRYFDHEILQRIEEQDPDLVMVPSIWPETYCYVLSSAFASGRRIVVFDLGAQADRCREHDPRHLVLPLALAQDPAGLATALLGIRQPSPAPGPDSGVPEL